ncbi:hypothetical protein [Streptomyces djakartensis]|jgi:hypothetical protein|uniref:hypothetical protein n=1 Tax=Streptomyces djakartensis TaxID=68193 RepID=UPI0034DEE67E
MMALALLTPLVLLGVLFALDAFEGFLFPPPPAAPPDAPEEATAAHLLADGE